MQHYDTKTFGAMMESKRRPFHDKYFSMYSSVYGGIVTDPILMMLPIDDHLVHRGDGVFETFKCVEGRIYNMRAHLVRFEHAMSLLEHRLPDTIENIGNIVVETVRAGGRQECLVRVIISRGPGSLGVDPNDCPESQLYVVVYNLKKPFMVLHPEGASMKASSVPVKKPFFAGVKSCNYLPNVLMKKESVELGVDFVAGFDEEGMLAEGATENVGIVTQDRRLLFPKTEGVLCGTTMMRIMDLAAPLVASDELSEVCFADISKNVLADAAEILVTGTTPNLTTVTEFEGEPVGDGKPGPIFVKLSALLLDDISSNAELQTPVFG
jgi:branched-subunit amino acid aminotransferase/4-amino-4-deoxychorismate lyase